MADAPNGQNGGRSWKGANGTLTYSTPDGTFSKALWVNRVTQPIQLSVSKHQSRKYSQVYPRSYAPGNITVDGICQSHTKYHELSLFIRRHQIAIIDSPVTDRFARLATGNTSGFRRLLQLSVPTEGILVRGWIDGFNVVNKGHFDIAPQYNFDFFVVFDSMSEDIGISHTIKGVYNEDDNVYADRKRKAPSSSDQVHEPGERDYPERRPLPPESTGTSGGGGTGSGGGGGGAF